MNEFSYRLIHDRPNQRLRLVRYSTGRFGYTIKADIDLTANVRVERQDGGGSEMVSGRRTFVLIWGDGPKQRVELTANSKLEVTIEDESTLVKLDDGVTAYNFAYVAATPELAGDHLEQILRRIIRQTGYLLLGEGLIDLDDGAVKDTSNIKVSKTGAVMPIPTNTTGLTIRLEAPTSTDYVRFTIDGDNPDHAEFNGNNLYDKEITIVGKAPGSNYGDIAVIPNIKFLRNSAWAGDGVLHIVFWGLQ